MRGSMTERSRTWWCALAVGAFVSNLVWENAHGVLYDHVIPGWVYLRAAGGDVLLVALGIGLAWPARRISDRAHVAASAVLLAVIAVVVERAALAEGRWGYTDLMPTIGGIGLSPLLQLPLTGLATWWFASWWAGARGRRGTAVGSPTA